MALDAGPSAAARRPTVPTSAQIRCRTIDPGHARLSLDARPAERTGRSDAGDHGPEDEARAGEQRRAREQDAQIAEARPRCGWSPRRASSLTCQRLRRQHDADAQAPQRGVRARSGCASRRPRCRSAAGGARAQAGGAGAGRRHASGPRRFARRANQLRHRQRERARPRLGRQIGERHLPRDRPLRGGHVDRTSTCCVAASHGSIDQRDLEGVGGGRRRPARRRSSAAAGPPARRATHRRSRRPTPAPPRIRVGTPG